MRDQKVNKEMKFSDYENALLKLTSELYIESWKMVDRHGGEFHTQAALADSIMEAEEILDGVLEAARD